MKLRLKPANIVEDQARQFGRDKQNLKFRNIFDF